MQRHTRTTHQNVAWFRAADHNNQLEIHPPYQRNPVWSVKQKSSLIETILYEYPIPELYMQEIVTDSGIQNHIIVDGQQRITSVLEFIRGEFELVLDNSKWNGLNFDDLRVEDRRKIFEYSFVIRVLPDLPDEEVRAIFQRINRNTVVLNAQELRHATYWGSFIKTMEDLADLDYWSKFEIFSPNDRRRMMDVEFVSELAVSYLNGLQNKKTKLEDYYQIYEIEFEEKEKTISAFLKVLGEIDQCLNVASTRFRKKSDFYTLFLCLAERSKLLPLSLEQRVQIGRNLSAFSSYVDQVLKVGIRADASDPIVVYARNVERAASDLGARKARHRALAEFIDRVLSSSDDVIVLDDRSDLQPLLDYASGNRG